MTSDQLWAMHLLGSDDLYAKLSREQAENDTAEFNAWWLTYCAENPDLNGRAYENGHIDGLDKMVNRPRSAVTLVGGTSVCFNHVDSELRWRPTSRRTSGVYFDQR